MLIQIVHGVMVIIVDMHMHALQFINFAKFNFKKTQLLVFQKDPVGELLTEYSSFLEKALLSCGTNFSGEEQNFQKKLFQAPKFSLKILFPRNNFSRTKIPVTATIPPYTGILLLLLLLLARVTYNQVQPLRINYLVTKFLPKLELYG